MGMMSEFREFAVKGNVVDLAVGVIIGAAFGKIVDSLVGDLIMPVVGKFTGGLDFTQYYIALAPVPANIAHTLAEIKKAGIPVIAWGNFVNILMNFVILAFIVFLMVKRINRMRSAKPAAPAARDNRRNQILFIAASCGELRGFYSVFRGPLFEMGIEETRRDYFQ